ncbi:hypothetical protein C7N43_00645 [Sphingobacteriales bacterium UPWRP_1]|nr:hypothetical protein B6N25_10380 [Sphingobacteriales bacterium TSM_CSS]PSJ78982.1 hypothetical protein C7N43_00645 [Sphingobacteriales bacterium UPWRP_1]
MPGFFFHSREQMKPEVTFNARIFAVITFYKFSGRKLCKITVLYLYLLRYCATTGRCFSTYRREIAFLPEI